jgi:glucose 1-dehydrogenase
MQIKTGLKSSCGTLAFPAMKQAVEKLFDLTGKVALLTGAARGIGLAMAQALVSAGCAVAIQDIDLPTARTEAEAIKQSGGRAAAFGGDVRDLALPSQLVPEVIQQLGRLDILVNNAALQTEKHWLDIPIEQMQGDFNADLLCPIQFIKAVIPIFKSQQSGRIINIGSVQQRSTNPRMFAYSISKGALEKITAGLSRELAKDGITINQIAPGWINTDRNRHHLTSPEVVKEQGAKHIPIGRLGEPSDFRGIILLLCSDAGSYITGQSIFVDGGMR